MLLAIYSFTLVALGAAASWWALKVRKVDVRNWAGAAVLVLWVAGVGARALVHAQARDDADDFAALHALAAGGATAGLGSGSEVAWSAAAQIASPAAPSGQSGAKAVGSVESFIAPLEARLAKAPGDAAGWALLAQSYAFVGDEAGVEKAEARAVALGIDRKDLEQRIAAVRRTRGQ